MEWIKKNKKIILIVLSALVLVCIGLGIYFVSENNASEKASKESTEKTVEKQEDSKEIQDEEDTTKDMDVETVADDTTQTESNEVAEETPTETTQPSTSTSDTTSNGNSTTNNNTTSGNTTNSNSISNGTTNSDSTTYHTSSYGIKYYEDDYGWYWSDRYDSHGEQLTLVQATLVQVGFGTIVVEHDRAEGPTYSVMVHNGEYEKGMKILEDYLATLGYERIGGSGSWIDNSCDQYGVYVDYNEIKEIQTEDNIVWD